MLFAVVVMNMVRTWRPNSAQPLTNSIYSSRSPPACQPRPLLLPLFLSLTLTHLLTLSTPSPYLSPYSSPYPTTPHQPQVYLTSETRVRIDEPGINDPPIKLLVTGLNFLILYMLQVP